MSSVEPTLKYVCNEHRSINMVVLGSNGVGKTTLIKMLRDPSYVSVRQVLSQTKSASFEELHYSRNGFSLRVLEFAGPFESSEKSSDIQTNRDLLQLVHGCIDFRMTRINAIVITINGNTGFTGRELESATVLMNFLGHRFSDVALLAVTHCESMTEDSRKRYVKRLMEDEKTKQVLEYCKLGAIFTGSMDSDLIIKHPTLFSSMSKDIQKLQEDALDKITSSTKEMVLSIELIEVAKKERINEMVDNIHQLEEEKKKLQEQVVDILFMATTKQKEHACP
eukprot:TRINITY_DN12320_c0_g1_i1.p1 TRINITY_DN12320_c0_g1~~TRINITY_DN12320_c0_g1_i1.p1  ORF type:complete len:280 (-),score=23.98 TRINITY_DN12320_c0_g1_i1:39-878(-)